MELSGKESIGRMEYISMLDRVFHPRHADFMRRHEERLDREVQRGRDIRLNPEAVWQGEGESLAGGRIGDAGVAQEAEVVEIHRSAG